jgi:nucleotide-binding universal stress UspA family protein
MLEGDPVDALAVAARDEPADLLVVGACGPEGFLHPRRAAVSHSLTHRPPGPLAAVPRPAARAVHHLVVGVDGSPASAAAVEVTVELAARLAVAVTAVHAERPRRGGWGTGAAPGGRRSETALRRWAAPISAAGVAVDHVVHRDVEPAAAIGLALHARAGSVAVVGGGSVAGPRRPRVAAQLLHDAGAAVLVVPSR